MNTALRYALSGYGYGLGQSTADTAVKAGTAAATAVVPTMVGPSVAALLGSAKCSSARQKATAPTKFELPISRQNSSAVNDLVEQSMLGNVGDDDMGS